MSAPTEQTVSSPDQHCLMAPTINTLDRARKLLDKHAGHKVCAAYRAALEFSSEVLGE